MDAKSNGQTATNRLPAEGLTKTATHSIANCARYASTDVAVNAKQTTQQLKFAPDSQLVGITIRRISNSGHSVQHGQHGDFLVTRSGTCRYFADLASLVAFGRQIGVKQ